MAAVVVAGRHDRSRLPAQPSGFVDREREIRRVRALLNTSRCLTLTGMGGIGKTRLALEAVSQDRSQSEAIWFVELSGAVSAVEVASRVLLTLLPSCPVGEDPFEMLAAELGKGRDLLILDGCERQLESCAALVHGLIRRCPGLVVLATSREPLSVEGEVVYRVGPLRERDGAVQLFIDRALAAAPEAQVDDAAIGQICQLLDGIPLAIELTAPWMELLTPIELLSRLDDRLGFSTTRRGGHHRQRTLRATIDWSYQLLSEPERALFRRLAVFSGGFTVDAVEAICDDGEVEQSQITKLSLALSRKSLLHHEVVRGQLRHRLLDTIRQFALEHLREAGEETRYRDRHLRHFLHLAKAQYRRLMRTQGGSESSRLAAERDNLVGAVTWARDRHPEKGLALAGTLVHELTALVGPRQGYELLCDMLDRCPSDPATRARALNAAGTLAMLHNALEDAGTLIGQAAALAEECGNIEERGWADFNLAVLDFMRDDQAEARRHVDRALHKFDQSGVRFGYVRALIRRNSFDVFVSRGVIPGEQRLQRALDMAREMGDGSAEAAALGALAYWAFLHGDRTRAVSLFKQALTLDPEDEGPMHVLCLSGLAAAISRSDPWKATRLWGSAAAEAHRAGWDHLPPAHERVLAGPREQARRLVGPDLARTWAEGAALTKKQVLAEAAELELSEVVESKWPGGLTEREFEIARLVAEGASSRQVANRTHVSVRTVENHVQHACSKLGFHRRTQLARWFHNLRTGGANTGDVE